MARSRTKPTPAYRTTKPVRIAEEIARGTKELIDQGKTAVNNVREGARKIKRSVSR